MATISVATSKNLTAVTYASGDIIDILNGVTLTIDSSFVNKPQYIRALGNGRIEINNTSTTTPILLDFYYGQGGLQVEQNAVLQIRGNWIEVATGTGTTQTLFTSNNVNGVNIDYPTKVQVETAANSDIYEDWVVIPEMVAGGEINALGFNKPDTTAGTVAITAGGVVTGTGTAFDAQDIGSPFRAAGQTQDYVVSAFSTATSITIVNPDGSTYSGSVIGAGATYVIRDGVLTDRSYIGNQDVGKLLFYNPLTTVVQCGNGTNGTAVPSGAKVRIPNIHITTQLFQTTTTTAVTSAAAQAITLASTAGFNTNNNAYSSTGSLGTLLLVSGATYERIYYNTKTGNVVNSSGMVRGVYGTTARTSFPIGTTVYFIPAQTSGLSLATMDCDTSGTVDIEKVSFGARFYAFFNNFKTLRVVDIGAMGTFRASSSSGAYMIDGVSVLAETFYYPGTVAAGMTLNNMFGYGTIKNLTLVSGMFGMITTAASPTYLGTSNIPNISELSKLRVWVLKKLGNTTSIGPRGIALQQIGNKNSVIRDLSMVGCSFYPNASRDITIEKIRWADLPSSGFNPIFGNLGMYIDACNGITMRDLNLMAGGAMMRQTFLLPAPTSANCIIHNKGYAPIDFSGNCPTLLNDQAANTAICFFNITNPRLSGQGWTPGNQLAGVGGIKRKIRFPGITSIGSGNGIGGKGGEINDVVTGPIRTWNSTVTNSIIPNMSDVPPIIVVDSYASATAGYLHIGPFANEGQWDMYDITAGTPYQDNLGRWYLPTIGDQIIIKTTHALRAITAFPAGDWYVNGYASTINTPLPNVTTEWRMSKWGETPTGAWTTLSSMTDLQTALSSLSGYDSNVGLNFQVRYTATASNVGTLIYNTLIPITVDSNYNPKVYKIDLTVTGIQSGSSVVAYDTTAGFALLDSVIGSSTIKLLELGYDFDGSNVPYRLNVRKAGYTFQQINGTYNQFSFSLPVSQIQVLSTSLSPLYEIGPFSGIAVDHGLQKITLTTSRTIAQVWSYVQDLMCELVNMSRDEFLSTNNGSSYNLVYDLEINNCTLSGSGSLSMSTKTVTFVGTGSTIVPITDITGTKTNIAIDGFITGSRIQVYNVNDSLEIFNDVVTGTSKTIPVTWTTNKSIRIRIVRVSGVDADENIEVVSTLTSSGLSITVIPSPSVIYETNGIDGSLVTEFTSDYPNVQIDIDDPDGTTSVKRIYAWYKAIEYTEDGIRNFFNGLYAEDELNYIVRTAIVDLMLDNVGTPVIITSARLYRDDNATIIGNGSIQMDPGKAYVANSDLITRDLATIKNNAGLIPALL